MPTFAKDQNAVLDWAVDWTDWLQAGEVITSSTWLPSVPTGLTVASETDADGVATVWLTGGTIGTTYAMTNRITTNGGRTDDRTIWIEVQQR